MVAAILDAEVQPRVGGEVLHDGSKILTLDRDLVLGESERENLVRRFLAPLPSVEPSSTTTTSKRSDG